MKLEKIPFKQKYCNVSTKKKKEKRWEKAQKHTDPYLEDEIKAQQVMIIKTMNLNR
jgi:hypothetical protein